jgi:selenocysteine lyase/cysteine desulfurase
MGLVDPQAMAGLLAVATWHQDHAAAFKIFDRIDRLTRYCRRQASCRAGLEVLTPERDTAGLVVVRLRGVEARACALAMCGEGIVVRSIPDNDGVRISCGFFNTFDEIDRAMACVEGWASPGRHASSRT